MTFPSLGSANQINYQCLCSEYLTQSCVCWHFLRSFTVTQGAVVRIKLMPAWMISLNTKPPGCHSVYTLHRCFALVMKL